MSRDYVVARGDCMSAIAAAHGFSDWRQIYDAPENAAFKQKRPNPNLIFPGDRLSIPDREPKTVECKPGQKLRIQVNLPMRQVVLSLRDAGDAPLAGADYELEAGAVQRHGQTGPDGTVRESLPVSMVEAKIRVAGQELQVRVGDLDPLEQVGDDLGGVQARLANLGYDPGPLDGKPSDATRLAIRWFQFDAGLPQTGEADDDLRKKLAEAHGC